MYERQYENLLKYTFVLEKCNRSWRWGGRTTKTITIKLSTKHGYYIQFHISYRFNIYHRNLISFVCLNKFSPNSIIIIFYRLPYFLSHFIFPTHSTLLFYQLSHCYFVFFSLLLAAFLFLFFLFHPFYIIIFGFMSFFAKCFSIRLIQFLISYLHYVPVKWLQMKTFSPNYTIHIYPDLLDGVFFLSALEGEEG